MKTRATILEIIITLMMLFSAGAYLWVMFGPYQNNHLSRE